MNQQQDPQRRPATPDRDDRTPHRIRRTPNFLRFIVTGAVIGFVVGALIASNGPDAPGYSDRTGIALIGTLLAALGALAGALVGLLLERLLNRP